MKYRSSRPSSLFNSLPAGFRQSLDKFPLLRRNFEILEGGRIPENVLYEMNGEFSYMPGQYDS